VPRRAAPWYDLIYAAEGKDYAAEADELHRVVLARAPEARTLLDVACGTGGHLVHLRRWFEVAGVDLDPAMLAEARAKLPGVDLIEADMRSFDLGRRFDAVVCLFSAVGYLRTAAELDAAVAAMARHLEPGGVLVVDGWVRPDLWRGPVGTDVVVAPGESVTVVRAVLARRTGAQTHLEMQHLVVTEDSVEHFVDEHDLTLFEDSEYRGAFARARLAVETMPSPMPGRDRYVGTRG
jgi:dTDP-3-amino-3,4,6-trideoxy-alpha-D-glucopyranose N,N-dimethyltransferase